MSMAPIETSGPPFGEEQTGGGRYWLELGKKYQSRSSRGAG
jgi:hypothetical protein